MVELKTTEELEQFIKHHRNAVIDFYASWCVPCKALAPKFEQLSNELSTDKTVFAKFDIDVDLQFVKSKYGLRSVPTVIIFTDCGEKHASVLSPTYDSVKSRIESLIK